MPTDLNQALEDVLSDFTLSGAYLAPDRSQAVLQFAGRELELRTIGERSWVRVEQTWREEAVSTPELLTPLVVCEEIAELTPAAVVEGEPGKEALGRIQATRYHLVHPDASTLGPMLGPVSGAYTMDIWLADGEQWPAQVLIQSRGEEDGGPEFRLSMDIRDAGEAGIRIEEPLP
jgi:hypothetical protein